MRSVESVIAVANDTANVSLESVIAATYTSTKSVNASNQSMDPLPQVEA